MCICLGIEPRFGIGLPNHLTCIGPNPGDVEAWGFQGQKGMML